MTFDCGAPNVPGSAVADVVSEINSHGKPPLLSDEERYQRRLDNQLYLAKCRERDEQRRREYQQDQAAREEAAQREAAIAAAEAHRRSRQDRHAQIEREFWERELRSLRLEMTKAQWWQQNVDAAARNAIA